MHERHPISSLFALMTVVGILALAFQWYPTQAEPRSFPRRIVSHAMISREQRAMMRGFYPTALGRGNTVPPKPAMTLAFLHELGRSYTGTVRAAAFSGWNR